MSDFSSMQWDEDVTKRAVQLSLVAYQEAMENPATEKIAVEMAGAVLSYWLNTLTAESISLVMQSPPRGD